MLKSIYISIFGFICYLYRPGTHAQQRFHRVSKGAHVFVVYLVVEALNLAKVLISLCLGIFVMTAASGHPDCGQLPALGVD
jgi:hypothetical protein